MAAPKNHDLRGWVVILSGIPLDQVNKISIEFPDKWKKDVGGQGEVTRSKSNDQTCKCTLTVPENSIANTLLDQLFEADDNTPGGVTYPFLVKDALGTTMVTSLNAWIMKKANVEESADAGEREWVIDCGDTQSVIAGK